VAAVKRGLKRGLDRKRRAILLMLITLAIAPGTRPLAADEPAKQKFCPVMTTVLPHEIGTLISPGPSLSHPPGHTVRLNAGSPSRLMPFRPSRNFRQISSSATA